VLLFISEKEIDSRAVAGRDELRFERLPTVGLPSPFSPAILGFARRFNESLSRCREIYRTFKPQMILGMGGFTSTAPVLAGRMRGVPSFVHESNAIPGKANRMTARMVRAVLLGFKECRVFSQGQNGGDRHRIRAALKPIDRFVARQNLTAGNLPTLLVMGGSRELPASTRP
jgi:UDP-N-acetylglucosamine--N-acetylmuramyl-(pentapeptide) pyrophosphoryl-undecaprenol N-acetylglucosamine transferase